MKNFGKIVEEWAMRYKPMQHVPGETSRNKRFFLIDSIVSIADFMTGIPTVGSPCVMFEFYIKADITGGRVKPAYAVYFPVNSGTSKPNKSMAANAVNESAEHAFKFLAWIRSQQEEREELRNVDTQNVRIDTIGPFLNGWYATFLELTDVDTFNICVNKEDYVDTV